MKKIYMLLVVFIALPLSVFASNTDTVVKNGVESIAAQDGCGIEVGG